MYADMTIVLVSVLVLFAAISLVVVALTLLIGACNTYSPRSPPS